VTDLKSIVVALGLVIKFRKYRVFEHAPIREFYLPLRSSYDGFQGGKLTEEVDQ
jgi:hypothetical protein